MLLSENIYPVILSGGQGTRLWPLSRASYPKQFLKIGSEHSLLRQTALRVLPLSSWKNIRVVATLEQEALTLAEFPEMEASSLYLEPFGRNTAAAIALAALKLVRQNPNAIMIVLPADQMISKASLKHFHTLLSHASNYVQNHASFITLGIHPRYPATGYGYIEQGEAIQQGEVSFYEVKSFKEKPPLAQAEYYLSEGNTFWNSGMFVWKAKDYLDAYFQFLPQDAAQWSCFDGSFESVQKIYEHISSISVDYAILEKVENKVLIPADIYWDDVGALNSLAAYYPHDEKNNSSEGEVLFVDSRNNFIKSDSGLVACLGVDDLVIIKDKEVVLVIPKNRSEEVKSIIEKIKSSQYANVLK